MDGKITITVSEDSGVTCETDGLDGFQAYYLLDVAKDLLVNGANEPKEAE